MDLTAEFYLQTVRVVFKETLLPRGKLVSRGRLIDPKAIRKTPMEVLDTTIVNVSLPHIAGTLSISSDESTWALTTYLVANGIVLTISGSLMPSISMLMRG